MTEADRWQSRPRVAFGLRVLIVAVPIAVAMALSLTAALLLPPPDGTGQLVLWWTAVLATSAAVMLVGEVAARQLLPLVALLQLSLLFPGPAPSRLAVSRQSSRRELRALAERVRQHGLGNNAEEAAVTLVRLIAALDAHDRRTRGHSERVRAITDLLAERLDVEEADRNKLRWAALLHDIGKLAIPFEVLNKPGRLTEQEWELIHRHPAEGDAMLGGLRAWLGEWAPVALEHHERWDGQGYPNGVAGEDICYGARIVALADAYDVMTSVRSYQPRPKSQAAALEEVVSCAGSQFDPEVARTMVNVSTRRLWIVLGPVAWLAQIPLLGPLVTAGLASQAAVVSGGAVTSVALASGSQGGFGGLARANRPLAPSMARIPTPTSSSLPAPGDPTSPTSPSSSSSSPSSSSSSSSTPSSSTSSTSSTSPSSSSSTSTSPSTSTTSSSTSTRPSPSTSASSTPTSTPTSTSTGPGSPTGTTPTTTTSGPRGSTTTTLATGTVRPCTPEPAPTTTTTARPDLSTSTTAVRPAPVAVADAVTLALGMARSLDVLANDRDPDDQLDPATLRPATRPTKGRVTVVDGRLRYRAPTRGGGTDTFTYAVEDRTGRCATAEVTITLR